ncbi:MAG: hydrogenase nickel incorporation protein HypB [Coriobacteriales bacterium]|jgi:hydrogenase nickel incorporation protein HypB|nr:hydrogenase nickel incorporation protein HypB [Coriobacteriales bacterium]
MEVKLKKPILDLNNRLAQENRELMAARGIFVLDLLASPGAGKTSLILATIEALRSNYRIAVIEGDIASDVDAVKIKEAGIPAIQINTGGACHLESAMIARALEALDLDNLDLIIIENVGNLVCPTDFDLGEDAKAMILSVPEGHDKPLKYPGVFQVAQAVILNKVDTLASFNFDEGAFKESVAQLNPHAVLFPLSALTHEGVVAWAQWLSQRIEEKKSCNS